MAMFRYTYDRANGIGFRFYYNIHTLLYSFGCSCGIELRFYYSTFI